MTEYMIKNDKNGRPRYYKSVDGRLKLVGRAEYEANTVTTEVVEPESQPKETALETVKRIVSGMDGWDESKVKVQTTKHAVLINYRNCMVCALDYDDSHTVTGIRFMGTTVEGRKRATVCEVKDLSEYADKIAEQVMFIDRWWANSSKKKAA